MSSPSHYTFSRPVPRDPADEIVNDKLFSINRRDNALNVNPGANYVRSVTDEPLSDWESVFDSAATSLLSGVPGVPDITLRSAYVRSAMRGQGRDATGHKGIADRGHPSPLGPGTKQERYGYSNA